MKYSREEVKNYYKQINKFLNTKYEEGLRNILSSQRFQELLKIKNLMHTYSLFNTILIVSQRPEILEKEHLVMPRYKWEKLGRKVKENAEPIWIWRPNPKKIYRTVREELPEELKKYEELAKTTKNAEEFVNRFKEGRKWKLEAFRARDLYEEKSTERALKRLYRDLESGYVEREMVIDEILYFKPEKVYTEEDTYGRDLPDIRFKTLTGNELKRFYEMIRDTSPVPIVETEDSSVSYRGKYDLSTGKITIVKSNSYNAMVSTLIHELGHAIRHRERLMKPDKNFEEAVVESTAISILTRLGVKNAIEYRGEYVLSFLNAHSEKDLRKRGKDLFRETNKTVRALLENVPAIEHAISEIDRNMIEHEHRMMMEMEESMGKEEEMEVEV